MNLFSVNSFFGILIIIFLVFFLLVGLLSLIFLARLFTLVFTRKKGMVDTLASCHPSAPPPSQLPSYSEAVIARGFRDQTVIDMDYRDHTVIDSGYRDHAVIDSCYRDRTVIDSGYSDDRVIDMSYRDHPPSYADIAH